MFEGDSSGRFTWDMKHVVNALDRTVMIKNPPARVLVGLDAKFVLDPLSRLPAGCGMSIIRRKPAMMASK